MTPHLDTHPDARPDPGSRQRALVRRSPLILAAVVLLAGAAVLAAQLPRLTALSDDERLDLAEETFAPGRTGGGTSAEGDGGGVGAMPSGDDRAIRALSPKL